MSHLDDVVYALETKMADTSLVFLKGKINLAKNEQRRRCIVSRVGGTLSKSDGPARQRNTSDTTFKRMIFRRDEIFDVRLLAESEDALDVLFDRLANAIFEHFGPNALYGDVDYRWLNDDSKGGSHTARQPGIEFQLRVRLRSFSDDYSRAILEQAEGTVTLGATGVTDNSVETNVPPLSP